MIVVLLFICTCSYLRAWRPQLINGQEYRHGFKGIVRKAAVVGDRLSPYVSAVLVCFAFGNVLYR